MATDRAQVNATPTPTAGLTEQQQRAVTARGVSVALSAGAGCGKTFVLTERFLRELEPWGHAGDEGGSPIFADTKIGTVPERRSRLGQLVAITFTERAAREMRSRIRKACRQRLKDCPEQQVGYWLGLVREMDAARISTIHSFCGSLLRAHAVDAGIDPRFRVLDGAQAGTLLLELTDDALRTLLAARDEATLTLVTRFGLDRLREMIARLLAARQEIDWSLWQGETAAGLVRRWEDFWRRDTLPRVLRRIATSTAAKTLLDLAKRCPTDHPVMRQRCEFLREQLSKLSEASVSAVAEDMAGAASPEELLAAIRENAKVQGGGTKKNWTNDSEYDEFRDAAKALRDMIDKAGPQMAFDASKATPAAEIALRAMLLAADVAGQYDAEKRELGVLDFDDLLIRARDLLTGDHRRELRKQLAGQIRLLLVDEFQDTDPLQVELVKALCNNEHLRGKLFFVGDFKQSIYRFRGADPSVFRQLREEIPADGQLPLSLNFRSQPAVLDFVNELFCEELGPGYEPLRAHRPQVSPQPAIEFLWANRLGTETPNTDAPGPRETESVSLPSPLSPLPSPDEIGRRERLLRTEADWIARRIRGLLESGEEIVWDEKAAEAKTPKARPARQGDFAILFRALTDVQYYEEALRRYGVNYYLVGGHAFYSQQEIYDLLNLLRTINVPDDEVSLAGALRSPMFGLHDETLFWLSRHSEGLAGGLFTGPLPSVLDGRQRQQAEFAAGVLRDLRAVKDRLPVAGVIQEAMRRTGYDALLLAEFLGERKLANLQKLIERARSFDAAGIFTLADFITQLSEFVARQPDEALAATQPELADVVKLMTIHQSKGLEFPVVIVPDVGRPRRVAGPSIAFSRGLGPVLKDEDATTGYDLLMAAERDEEQAELGRLLYVATTRAADRLILSAGVEEAGECRGPWMELIGRRFELATGAVKEGGRRKAEGTTGGDSGSSCRVLVTSERPAIRSKPVDSRQRRDLMKIAEKAEQMAADGQGKWSRYLATVPCDVGARRQYSFSRLTGTLHARTAEADAGGGDGDLPAQPRIDALGLGTLVHAVLEEIDFAAPADVVDRVHRLAEQHLSGEERQQEQSLAVEMVERFAASPRAAQIAAAKEVHRELEFLLAWPPGGGQTDGRYLEGVIDCLYRDAEGAWRLVDYKTNQATAETLAGKAAAYEMQMLVYGLAVETILGRPPAELTLCFLRPGLEYRFAWDDAARRRAVELVAQALPAES
jgi:ATP-dependent helicase/nuclease subunit A